MSPSVPSDLALAIPRVLGRIPKNLHTFDISCPDNQLGCALYQSVRDAKVDGAHWNCNVAKVAVSPRPDGRDVAPFFAHFHHITHLHLSLSDLDDTLTFSSPITSLQLQSLAVDVYFLFQFQELESDGSPPPNGSPPPDQFTASADRLRHILEPVCSNLQSMTLSFPNGSSHDISLYIEIFRKLHSIGSSTVTTLILRVVNSDPGQTDSLFAEEVAKANAFALFPALRHLVLDEFGITLDAFGQMGCSELRTLDVVVMSPESEDGWETMSDVLNTLALPELARLNKLGIKFAMFPHFYEGRDSFDNEWYGTEATWAPVQEACAARNIECIIEHPHWQELDEEEDEDEYEDVDED